MRYDSETKTRALARYKDEIASALAWYNCSVAETWRGFGCPAASANCKASLDAIWTAYVKLLGYASERFNRGLDKAKMVATRRLAYGVYPGEGGEALYGVFRAYPVNTQRE